MADRQQHRIVELQKALKIARTALEKISNGQYHRDPCGLASEALYEMLPLEKLRPLQGLLGHERSKP